MGLIHWFRSFKNKEKFKLAQDQIDEESSYEEVLRENLKEQGEKLVQRVDSKEEVRLAVEKDVHELIGSFSNVLGVTLPAKALPAIKILDGSEKFESVPKGTSYYNSKENVLAVYTGKSSIPLGEHVGEEVGHFFRRRLRKGFGEQDGRVSEFYGFLGRLLVGKMGEQNPELAKRFPVRANLTVTSSMGTKQQLSDFTRYARESSQTQSLIANSDKAISEAFEGLSKSTKNPQLKSEFSMNAMSSSIESILHDQKAESLDRVRRSSIFHYRGYEWASSIDLNKISDWGKFFSMKDKQVIHRFFRPDKDYSGL